MKSEHDPVFGSALREIAGKCREKLRTIRRATGDDVALGDAAAALARGVSENCVSAAEYGDAMLAIGYLEAIADLNRTDLAILEVGLLSSKSPRRALANTMKASAIARELSAIQPLDSCDTASEALEKIDADLDAAEYHLRQSQRLGNRAKRRMRELKRRREE